MSAETPLLERLIHKYTPDADTREKVLREARENARPLITQAPIESQASIESRRGNVPGTVGCLQESAIDLDKPADRAEAARHLYQSLSTSAQNNMSWGARLAGITSQEMITQRAQSLETGRTRLADAMGLIKSGELKPVTSSNIL